VIFVAYHDPELMMSKMLRDLDLKFVLLLDRAREAYAKWGLETGTHEESPEARPRVGDRESHRQPQPSLGSAPPHHNQLGGDFVVDPRGNLVFVNRMRSVYDRATSMTCLKR
jgi:hypothetical protein